MTPAVLVCGLCLSLQAQQLGGDELLDHIRAKVAAIVERLSNYMCTETVDRSVYVLPTSGRANSCDEVMPLPPAARLPLSDAERKQLVALAYYRSSPRDGYAVLENAAMPVVGTIDVENNTCVEQIVADAKAAIDKAVEMGVVDRNRMGVGGHSYGAFMTANLLAHCDFFRAGIAEPGAYNRTLTPLRISKRAPQLLGSAANLRTHVAVLLRR